MQRTILVIIAAVVSVLALAIIIGAVGKMLNGPVIDTQKANLTAPSPTVLCDVSSCADANPGDCYTPTCVRDRCTQLAVKQPATSPCDAAGNPGRCDTAAVCNPVYLCSNIGDKECAIGQRRECVNMTIRLEWTPWTPCPAGICATTQACA